MSENTAFIGLGVMGYPMAGFLAKAGHNVTVYNRTTSKAEKWLNSIDTLHSRIHFLIFDEYSSMRLSNFDGL